MKVAFILIYLTSFILANNYSNCYECKKFINYMHNKYGFNKLYLNKLLSRANHMQSVLNRYNGTLKGATDYSWSRYKRKILIPESIELGRQFMKKNSSSLKRAKALYGVEKEIITSFIRVESKFGLYGGEYRVWDVLVTLSFNPNRKRRFFKSELEKFLLLSRREDLNPLEVKGSFAGAMGCVQQMPSIYLRYGVDLDNNGKKDPNSMADCIGSIAKFLSRQRWINNLQPVAKAKVNGNRYLNLRSGYKSLYNLYTLNKYGIYAPPWWNSTKAYYIRLKDKSNYDVYLGNHNYRVITKYNASKQYATSIGLYYKALKQNSY